MSDEPVTNGVSSKLSGYAVQLAMALLISTLGWLTATTATHISRLAAVESRTGSLEHQFERIEIKLDRALRSHK